MSGDPIREALDLGLQAWRTTPAREKFIAAQDALSELVREAAALREAASDVVEQFNLWSEDANDGEFAYYKSDGLMVACVKLREALAAVSPAQPAEEHPDHAGRVAFNEEVAKGVARLENERGASSGGETP